MYGGGPAIVQDMFFPVITLTSRKMEMPIVAPTDGTVKSVNCSPGDAVQGGDVLVVVE